MNRKEYLEKCAALVEFISKDYVELSKDKMELQRFDWLTRARTLTKEYVSTQKQERRKLNNDF